MITTTTSKPVISTPRHRFGENLPIESVFEPGTFRDRNALFSVCKSLSASKPINTTVNTVSFISLITLFTSSILNLGITQESSFKKKFNSFADLSNKAFQILNSLKNVFKLLPNRDYLNTLGHFADTVTPFFVQMKDFYIARGLALGLYTGAHTANVINEKSIFRNWGEHIEHLRLAAKKTWNNFKANPVLLLQRLREPPKAMMGALASVFCLSGFVLFKPLESMFGKSGRSVAAALRDIGGFCQSFEGMKPGHMSSGRVFWGLSAYSQMAGALANILAETVLSKYKSALDPLSFAFSGLNRWLFRVSNERGESAYHNKDFSLKNLQRSANQALKYAFS